MTGAVLALAVVVATVMCHVVVAARVNEPIARLHAHVPAAALPLLRGLDYRPSPRDRTLTEIFASESDLALLRQAAIAFDVVETAQPFKAKAAQVPDGYQTLSQLEAFLAETVRAYPSIAALVDSAPYGAGVTVEGRRIPIIKISGNVTVNEDEPAILINSNIHAREVVTPVLAAEIIRRLTTSYATDASIRNIVDNNQIFIMPTINPDGYEYMWNVNNMWRKNRKLNRDGSYGVDCNRNYDLGWDGECTGSSIPSSDTFRGIAAESEEETTIVTAFSRKFNLAKLVDFHSSGREVLVGYLCVPMTAALDNYIVAEGSVLASLSNYGTRRPSSDGEHQEWNIANVTAFSYLVETELEFQPPYADAIAEFERLWPMVLYALQRVIPVTGHITLNGRPVVATITVNQLNGDVTWKSDDVFGRYQLFLPDGVWTLSVSAPGSAVRTVSVNVNNAVSQVLNIAL